MAFEHSAGGQSMHYAHLMHASGVIACIVLVWCTLPVKKMVMKTEKNSSEKNCQKKCCQIKKSTRNSFFGSNHSFWRFFLKIVFSRQFHKSVSHLNKSFVRMGIKHLVALHYRDLNMHSGDWSWFTHSLRSCVNHDQPPSCMFKSPVMHGNPCFIPTIIFPIFHIICDLLNKWLWLILYYPRSILRSAGNDSRFIECVEERGDENGSPWGFDHVITKC